MSPLLIVLMLAAGLGLAGIGVAIVLALRLRRLEQQIHRDHGVSLTPSAPSATHNDFQAPLLQATLKQRLQQDQSGRPAPDKYRLAAEMLAQGMTAQQIADLLTLPPAEVRQLVNLSRVNRSNIISTADTDSNH